MVERSSSSPATSKHVKWPSLAAPMSRCNSIPGWGRHRPRPSITSSHLELLLPPLLPLPLPPLLLLLSENPSSLSSTVHPDWVDVIAAMLGFVGWCLILIRYPRPRWP